ncbi:MAG: ATP-binding protein [Anaerotignum sp.]
MKYLSEPKLSVLFTITVFIIQTVSSIVFPTITIIGMKMGYILNPNMVFILLQNLVFSILLGIVFSKMIGGRILKPITDLSNATSRVARGDFQIHLAEEKGFGKEVGEMIHNFNIMTNELKNIETLRNDFVSNVSHEFKTPLSTISGYAMLLQDEALLPEERDTYIEHILSSTQRLSKLTENILLISKLENQDIVLDKVCYSLDEQLRNDILALEPVWSEKELNWDIHLESISFYGNKNMLSLVWSNLLANAIKFTPTGGTISVRLKKMEDVVVISITDTGIGMSEETIKHIFEKFYCADPSRHSSGNGLGLPLAKRIISLCEGSISVESRETAGTTFTVRLPNTAENP